MREMVWSRFDENLLPGPVHRMQWTACLTLVIWLSGVVTISVSSAYVAPQYGTPQYSAPQYGTPQYPAGGYAAPIAYPSPMAYSSPIYTAQNPYPAQGGYAPYSGIDPGGNPPGIPAAGTGTAPMTGSGGGGIRFCSGDEFSRKFDLLVLDVQSDYANYYSMPTAIKMLIAVGIAAPMANTRLDMNFYDWYQDNVRSPGSDDVSRVVKNFGEGSYLLTLSGGITLTGLVLTVDGDAPFMQGVGDFGRDTLRAYTVGGPSVLAMQWILGGDRPSNGSTNWCPFSANHAVSGHAFVGAVPFIMLAKHSDSFLEKGVWYFASTLAGWSRINDGAHSLSQVGLGWYMAELACESVCATNDAGSIKMQFTPIFTADTTGVMATFRY